MTDWPEAVREYEGEKNRLYASYHNVSPNPELADAAIAALKEWYELDEKAIAALGRSFDGEHERRMRAEAEVKRLVEAHNDLFNLWEQASGEAAKAEAEVARLKWMLEIAVHLASGADDGCECAECQDDRRLMAENVADLAAAYEERNK